MRRNSDEERRRFERGGDDLRRYVMARRLGDSFEVLREIFGRAAQESRETHPVEILTDARIKTLRLLFEAGVEYPDPDVMALLGEAEQRLIVFSRYGDVSSHVMSSRGRFGFGDERDRVIYHTENGDDFLGREGLKKALALASDLEKDQGWAPMSVPHEHPWRSSRVYSEYFVENSIFLTRTGYAWRYLHYAGDVIDGEKHAFDRAGVQNLTYRYSHEHLGLASPSHLTISEERARLASEVAIFEGKLNEQLIAIGERARAWRGGRGIGGRDVQEVLGRLAQNAVVDDGDGPRAGSTDFAYSPESVGRGSWRGMDSTQASSPVGVVLGVRCGGEGQVTLGFGAAEVGYSQSTVRLERVWPELKSSRSASTYNRRLEEWARTPGANKIVVWPGVMHAWLNVFRNLSGGVVGWGHEYP